MTETTKLVGTAFLAGVFGGICGMVCVLLLIAQGTVRVHGLKITDHAGKTAIAIEAGKNGEGRIDFYNPDRLVLMSLGLQGGSTDSAPKLTPYASLGDRVGRSAITMAVTDSGKGVIAMGDNGIEGRLILGNIEWRDSGLNFDADPELWGLQVSGNPGLGRKYSTVGLSIGSNGTHEVNSACRSQGK